MMSKEMNHDKKPLQSEQFVQESLLLHLPHFLRFTVVMLVMMVLGITGISGATIDFNLPNGYYFLGNQAGNNDVAAYDDSDFEANYYMCPAYSSTVDEQNYLSGDGTKPLITTCKTFPNDGKTYLHAIWYIEAATGEGNAGYFYIKHFESGQYMVANNNTSPKSSRRRVNLGPTTNPGNDGMFKIQSDDAGVTFYISSRTKSDGQNKYLSPSNGNKDRLNANSDNDNTGGILGFWKEKDKNSAWHFIAQVIVDDPAITLASASYTYTGEEIKPGVTVNSGAIPSSEYVVGYSNNTIAGTATVTITNKPGGSYYVYDGSENFTIAAKEVGLSWGTTSFVYNGSFQQPTVALTGLIGADVCTVTVSGGQTDAGNYTATATGLSNPNYALPAANTQAFTITPKSLGSGSTPAENITCDVTETSGTYSIVVKHGGSNLTLGTDYTKSSESGVSDGKYYSVTIEGTGNYDGGFSVKLAKIQLSKRTGSVAPGGAALFVSNSDDDNFVVPDNMRAYIVTGISGNTLDVEELDNIPKQMPVLLVSTIDANGFLVQPKASPTPPSGTNLLKEATVASPVEAATIYLLYKGEFVLNAAGTLPAGKIYLPRPSGAPVKLFLDWDFTDGINSQFTIHNSQLNGQWYTIDGRPINGTPPRKGMYIVNGKKMIIR